MYMKRLNEEILNLSKKLSKAKTAATKLKKDYTTDDKYNKILKEIKNLKKRKIALHMGLMRKHQDRIEKNNGYSHQHC